MPARLDKPLRLTAAVQDGRSAIGGRNIVAIAPEDEPFLNMSNGSTRSAHGGEVISVEMIGAL
jgi:hypothetical protein